MRALASVVVIVVGFGCGPVDTHEAVLPVGSQDAFLLNGKRARLRFDGEHDRLAVGADLKVRVPRIPRRGHSIAAARWEVGALSRASVSPSVRLSATMDGEDLLLGLRCSVPGVFELQVMVTNADRTTVEDATDVHCIEVTRNEVQLGIGAVALPARHLVGGTLYAVVYRTGLLAHGSEGPLSGEAPVAVAPGSQSVVVAVATDLISQNVLQMTAVGVGEPSVTSLGFVLKLPTQIVDEPNWLPEVKIARTAQWLDISLRISSPDGAALYGLNQPCVFESVTSGVTSVEASHACGVYGLADSRLFKADSVCVTVMNRKACAPIPRA